ncbi:MAG: 2-oxoglutarate dehydrogenase E1 component [Bacteroidetes bacterium]|nr:2-oxoglutarate dehydrogenase E1 component [Bacteroidota bacterium]HET6245646.1 2-oxoglutarate dehydrogenase E1 component [Bacteroidia bacterium]
MDKYSYLSNADVSSIDELYKQFKTNPDELDISWKKFFEGFDFAKANYTEVSGSEVPENVRKEFNVINLITGYRTRGHLFTKTNPVRERRQYSPSLAIENFDLEAKDLEVVFQAGTQIGIGPAKLKDIVAHLEQTYCQSIGVEFMYIRNQEMHEWLKSKMEGCKNTPDFGIDEKKTILNKLNQAVVFENFLHTKFVGQKRFSLEGAETLIPALDTVVEKGAELGIDDFVIGMSHRGRLNVLANILNKTYKDIFTEFEGRGAEDSLFDGDVKYHLGYSSDQFTNKGKKIHLSLTPNPSHLEAVGPVVEGITRAKIDTFHKNDFSKAASIIIHGDAAIAGQGIVYEVIQMSQLEGYKTGGTIHIVVNNQVGFTTNYHDARSSTYCTDVAKVVLSPVFHVNGDDVEALVYVCQLAMEFRQKFQRDVFVDILCYRKYGHNEGDEPRFTQPILYKAIANHPNPRELYNNKLLKQGSVESGLAKEMEESFKNMLQEMLTEAKQTEKARISSFLDGAWKGLKMATNEDFNSSPVTAVDEKSFLEIAKKIATLPEGKNFFNKTKKLFKDRMDMIKNDSYDWGMGELMAYASLLNEGSAVRFSGQDVERGTFSHRHAVIKIEDSEEEYVPLNNFSGTQAKLEIYNSLLSEYGVLGFEFGYAMASPHTLTIWEAQFGDFFNGAQIIIDQFISCAEYKWRRMNGLVMLLPHGYEGMGPEHSSARIERFLQMCAYNNMQITNCTTPANFFHLLRRQLHRPFRKPLVVFTPKSLLRYPKCVSSLKDFTSGGFLEVIDDQTANPDVITKIAFCSGKIFYDLLEQKEKDGITNCALIRLEQLYPLPIEQLKGVLQKYSNAKEWLWVQEEPENMGAWSFILRKFGPLTPGLKVVSRPENSTPATGYSKTHLLQQKSIVDQVFENVLIEK